MIRFEGIHKTYRHPRQVALSGIDLEIPDGSVFGLLGPNGAGKTTLISILSGLLNTDRGRVVVDDRELGGRRSGGGCISLVPQDLAFYPSLSVRENLAFYTAAARVPRSARHRQIEQAVTAAALEAHLHKPAAHLSGGLKRRLNLAIGLLGSPEILVLDEPTVGVDPQSRHFILETLRRLNDGGMTILYASHYMEEVEQLCDRVAIIDHGRILREGLVTTLLAEGVQRTLLVDLKTAPDAALRERLEAALEVKFPTPERLAINTDRPGEALAALESVLAGSGVELRCVRYGCATLEALFLDLTQRELRD
ncbi:MAG: ABC transporter ATP-binding protein [Acidihalobacter sp.]